MKRNYVYRASRYNTSANHNTVLGELAIDALVVLLGALCIYCLWFVPLLGL